MNTKAIVFKAPGEVVAETADLGPCGEHEILCETLYSTWKTSGKTALRVTAGLSLAPVVFAADTISLPNVFNLAMVSACLVLAAFAFGLDAPGVTTVTPKPTSEVLLNPGKGWVLYGYGWPGISAESQEPKAMALGSIGYTRFSWAELEPVEGQFDWKKLEDALASWDKVGKQFAFGVMCMNSHSKAEDPYVTPKWVFDAGAKHRLIALDLQKNPYHGTPGQKAVPEFFDPVFLAKLKNFLNAMGQKFDGDPRIAFIDIRSYGNWGEGHMWPFGGKELTPAEYTQHVQMHLDAFKKSRLCISAEKPAHASVYDWAVQQGVAVRRDGICGNSNGSETLRAFGHTPGVFEYYGSYKFMKEKGWWDGKDISGNRYYGHKLTDCVENGKPSYLEWLGLDALEDERPLIERLSNRMGYHFVLKEAAFPSRLTLNGSAVVKLTWANEGVAPIYVPCAVALALLDAKDQPVEICWPESCKPALWIPDKPAAEDAKVAFTKARPGEYRLAVGLVQRTGDEKPWIRLGIEGRTAGGWYPLGPMELR